MPLILKRASASRPSGELCDGDYDVLPDGIFVGRIYQDAGAALVLVDLGPPKDWRGLKELPSIHPDAGKQYFVKIRLSAFGMSRLFVEHCEVAAKIDIKRRRLGEQ
jgi:hypothetical protein